MAEVILFVKQQTDAYPPMVGSTGGMGGSAGASSIALNGRVLGQVDGPVVGRLVGNVVGQVVGLVVGTVVGLVVGLAHGGGGGGIIPPLGGPEGAADRGVNSNGVPQTVTIARMAGSSREFRLDWVMGAPSIINAASQTADTSRP